MSSFMKRSGPQSNFNGHGKKIVKFETFEAQKLYFLGYYYTLTLLERLRALVALQSKGRNQHFKLEKKSPSSEII